jgi:hypothetical protein
MIHIKADSKKERKKKESFPNTNPPSQCTEPKKQTTGINCFITIRPKQCLYIMFH